MQTEKEKVPVRVLLTATSVASGCRGRGFIKAVLCGLRSPQRPPPAWQPWARDPGVQPVAGQDSGVEGQGQQTGVLYLVQGMWRQLNRFWLVSGPSVSATFPHFVIAGTF